jgi:hypothetical protein
MITVTLHRAADWGERQRWRDVKVAPTRDLVCLGKESHCDTR